LLDENGGFVAAAGTPSPDRTRRFAPSRSGSGGPHPRTRELPKRNASRCAGQFAP